MLDHNLPINILVVDDNVDNAVLLRECLQLSGYDVDIYFSPEEALENFKSGKYIVAVLDVLMDGISRIELYKKMSNIDTNIRVCFLTGCNRPAREQNQNCYQADSFNGTITNHQNPTK